MKARQGFPVPQIRKDGSLRETDWSEAVAAAATGLSSVRERYGASAIAMLTADHLTTEEAAAARAFFGDVLGCAHVGSLQAEGYRALCASLSRERGPRLGTGNDRRHPRLRDTLLVLGGGAAEFHPVLKPMINRLS
ncbi:MAG: molybdopterin-dependent oxidoreductase, partial [Syntrophales bacterium]